MRNIDARLILQHSKVRCYLYWTKRYDVLFREITVIKDNNIVGIAEYSGTENIIFINKRRDT